MRKAGQRSPAPDLSRSSKDAEPNVKRSAVRHPGRREPLWYRLGPPIVIVGAFYIGFVTRRILEFDVLWFVHLGREMLESSTTSSILMPELGWESEIGYDGQYYYAVAVDPANAADYMTRDDNAGYIYSRPLYPFLSRLVSLGQHEIVPYAMLLINVSAVVLGTVAIAAWLRRNDSSPWFSVLFGLYPGLVFSVFRDLTEPLAYGLVAIALWVFDPRDRRRVAAAAVILAFAALTRETVVLFTLIAAAVLVSVSTDPQRWWSWSRWRIPLAFLVVAIAPLALVKAIIGAVLGEQSQEGPGGASALIPLYGIASYWPWSSQQRLAAITVVVPALLSLAVALPLLLRRGLRPHVALLALNVAALVVFLPKSVYVDFGAASRAATGVVLATICCIPAWRSHSGRRAPVYLLALAAWSLPWYLLAAESLGIKGLDLITL